MALHRQVDQLMIGIGHGMAIKYLFQYLGLQMNQILLMNRNSVCPLGKHVMIWTGDLMMLIVRTKRMSLYVRELTLMSPFGLIDLLIRVWE